MTFHTKSTTDLLKEQLPRELQERLLIARYLSRHQLVEVMFIGRERKWDTRQLINIPVVDWLTESSLALICLTVT